MRNMQKATISLLVVGILFLIPLTALAASNWQFMNEENGSKYYIDINSVEKKGDSVFYNTKQIYSQGNYDIITMEYKPDKGVMRYYWEKQYDANGRLLQSVSTTADNPFGPVSSDYTEIQIVNKILAESKNNSQPSQQVSESPKSVSSSNTITKFPQELGDMHLVLAREVEQGIYEANVDLLSGQNGIRSIVLTKLNKYDNGYIQFKLDNGQYVGFSVSYDGKVSFDGDGCQPREIQGGVVTYHKGVDGYLKRWSFDGAVGMLVLGGGRLGIIFETPNNKKNFVVALPQGAQYLTGIVKVRNINVEVAFYK